jgi:predicted lipoprotein with Yx(FWY)xxD motif
MTWRPITRTFLQRRHGRSVRVGRTPPAAGLRNARRATATQGHDPTRYGPIVVDRGGRTLYLFTRDTGRASRCSGACARAWPPALAHGRLQAGRGTRRSLLGTIRRRDGGRQLTYAGHPLYRYAPETRAGQILCQNVTEYGGVWLVVDPDGTPNRSPR